MALSNLSNLSNGLSNHSDLPPTEYAEFLVGGRAIKVRALSLYDLDALKSEIRGLDPTNVDWITYGVTVMRILAFLTSGDEPDMAMVDAKARAMAKTCTWAEVKNLPTQIDQLLRISGFDSPGEDQAANPGTGTSTQLSPNSPQEASTEPTSSESSAE